MSTSRWRKMSALFEKARALPEKQRDAFLSGACGDDGELRREVEKLLEVSTDAIDRTPTNSWLIAPAANTSDVQSGGRIGAYRLLRVIASGGMGTVWEAEQETPRRRVALKVMRFGFSGPEDLSRFRYESEILGLLQHPGIAQVFEAGTHVAETEVPYFVMEYIEGAKTILEYARDQELSTRKRLELFLPVCDAVQHGHQRGVIHRDLKPSNILVDARGQPKIIDFGIARAAASDVSAKTLQTRAGQILGTLQYMSPEQFGPDSDAIDTRSDVYSLGVVMYELLVGRGPYDVDRSAIHEAARIVTLEPAIRPSSLVRTLGGDLEWIVLKAIDKERDRRYASASELAADIQRHLDDEPVLAGPPSRIYKMRKFVTRHRFGVGASILMVALLVGGLVTSLYFRARSEIKAREALEQAEVATQRANEVLSLSAIQDLKDLEDRVDRLWPAEPENVPKYEAWLADARRLIEGDPGDPVHGIKKRPSLAEHEAKLASIRARARPLTAEQIEADRKASPHYAEWMQADARLVWMRRMLGEQAWPAEKDVESELANETLPTDAQSLNDLAWRLVDIEPAKVVFGSEVRGLVLARRALARARDTERAAIRGTLAMALLRTGRLDEALAEARRAADEESRIDAAHELTPKRVQDLVATWKSPEVRAKQAEEVAQFATHVDELRRAVDERRTYPFEDGDDRWWHAQLSKLVSDLKSFTDEKTGGLFSSGTSAKYGWGIVKRLDYARAIQQRSVDGPEAKKRWKEAVAAVAISPEYADMKLDPQRGLLPIGADPESRLWEFADLQTGEPAERGAKGELIRKESMGLVFVLIPGRTFRMGAQSDDPSAPNYDAQALRAESPVHEVTLSPYFLSKYEMTQGQWERFVGKNPSNYGPSNYSTSWNRAGKRWSALHPVEQVTWAQCMDVMARLGLTLPSEAQWENGARGGQDSPFWAGSDLASLKNTANLADIYGKRHGNDALEVFEDEFDDGNSVHAEVGSYRANPFGLHDVIGNVWEWCSDGFDPSFYAKSAKLDPVAPSTGVAARVVRGGGFVNIATFGRSASRNFHAPEHQDNDIGLRPARAVRALSSSTEPNGH